MESETVRKAGLLKKEGGEEEEEVNNFAAVLRENNDSRQEQDENSVPRLKGKTIRFLPVSLCPSGSRDLSEPFHPLLHLSWSSLASSHSSQWSLLRLFHFLFVVEACLFIVLAIFLLPLTYLLPSVYLLQPIFLLHFFLLFLLLLTSTQISLAHTSPLNALSYFP